MVPKYGIIWLFALLVCNTCPISASYGQPYQASWNWVEKVVPNQALPDQVEIQKANNNLDLILFQDAYYLAFRTAPTHFASRKARFYVLRSTDMQNWSYELEINLGADIREPRFLALNDTLRLYCFEAGKKPYTFEPRHVHVYTRTAPRTWRKGALPELRGFVPWRFRTRRGVAYLSAYNGVDIYNLNHKPELRLFTSTNGLHWAPISPEPQVTDKGAEEGEFHFTENGELWATVRMEGAGGALAYTAPGDYANWNLIRLNRKYDSALLFEHQDELFLIARYNPVEKSDRAPKWLPKALRHYINLALYSAGVKRTALYWIDRQNKAIKKLCLLPSNGDTAFAGVAPKKDGTGYWVMNYTSPFRGKNWSWIRGQLNPTFIYLLELQLTPSDNYTQR